MIYVTSEQGGSARNLNEAEAWIFQRVLQADFSAIEELYHRYSRNAFGLALKILQNPEAAEDTVQEAFLRLWKNPTSYKPEKGKFATWLLTIVHNLAIDHLRHERTELYQLLYQPLNEEIFASLIDESINIEEEIWLKMQRVAIGQALNKLPAKQRYVIELAFFKGLTHKEIVLMSDLTLGTVKGRIRKGLLELRDLLASD